MFVRLHVAVADEELHLGNKLREDMIIHTQFNSQFSHHNKSHLLEGLKDFLPLRKVSEEDF